MALKLSVEVPLMHIDGFVCVYRETCAILKSKLDVCAKLHLAIIAKPASSLIAAVAGCI